MENPYSPGDAVPGHVVQIPGIQGRISVQPPGWVSGPKLLVDGAPAPPGSTRGTVLLSGTDGSDVEAKVLPKLWRTLPSVVIAGQQHDLGEAIPIPLLILAFAPFVLIPLGGCLGGLAGGVAVGGNLAIARQDWPAAQKGVAMLVLGGICVGLYLAVAVAITVAAG